MGRFKMPRATYVALVGVVFIACYIDAFGQLTRQWFENSVYSYGFLVPLISAYIAWVRWPAVKCSPRHPEYFWGAALIVDSMVMLTAGRLAALMSLEYLSLLVCLAGLVLLFLGRAALRALWFPIAYLLCMMPVWDVLLSRLQLPAQRAAATIATELLRVLGTPAFRSDTMIVLPSVSLEVLPECSGLNQLIALTVMAVPAAVLWIGGRVRQLMFVMVAIVLAYVSNGLRVFILGWLSSRSIPVSDPSSATHLVPGFVAISVAYLVLWTLLNRLARDREPAAAAPAPSSRPRAIPVVRRPWVEVSAIALLVLGAASHLIAVPPREPSSALAGAVPAALADWTEYATLDPSAAGFPGFDETLLGTYHTPTGERRFMDVDDELRRTYRSTWGTQVEMYIGYYRRQSNGRELAGDVAHALQRKGVAVQLKQDSETVVVNEVVQHGADADRGVVFWYDINGRTVSNIYEAKLYTLWDLLTRRRTSGAVIMVAWRGATGSPARQARLDALAFCQALLSFPNDIVP